MGVAVLKRYVISIGVKLMINLLIKEILRNGFDKLDNHGVTHLDLAAHGTVSLSR